MMRINRFAPANWYWVVGGSSTQVFSSASGDYVAAADATYQAWLAKGNKPTAIDTEANLGGVLAPYRLRPVNANVLAAWHNALADGMDVVQLKILFNHENRIRVLEGKQAITVAQFKAGVAALL